MVRAAAAATKSARVAISKIAGMIQCLILGLRRGRWRSSRRSDSPRLAAAADLPVNVIVNILVLSSMGVEKTSTRRREFTSAAGAGRRRQCRR